LTTLSESDRTFPSHHLPSSPPAIISLPTVEREISSESHQSNELSRDNDRLNWSLLSPPPPNYLQLPNCPICLRRLINRVSHLNEGTADERDKLIIGPAFIGHGDRCRVCHIYSDTSSLVCPSSYPPPPLRVFRVSSLLSVAKNLQCLWLTRELMDLFAVWVHGLWEIYLTACQETFPSQRSCPPLLSLTIYSPFRSLLTGHPFSLELATGRSDPRHLNLLS
jgi:hypothetical protein